MKAWASLVRTGSSGVRSKTTRVTVMWPIPPMSAPPPPSTPVCLSCQEEHQRGVFPGQRTSRIFDFSHSNAGQFPAQWQFPEKVTSVMRSISPLTGHRGTGGAFLWFQVVVDGEGAGRKWDFWVPFSGMTIMWADPLKVSPVSYCVSGGVLKCPQCDLPQGCQQMWVTDAMSK